MKTFGRISGTNRLWGGRKEFRERGGKEEGLKRGRGWEKW